MKKVSLLYIYIVILLLFAGCSHMVEDFKKGESLRILAQSVMQLGSEKVYTIIEEFESLDNDDFDSSLTKITSSETNPEGFLPTVPEGFELLPENKTFENNVLTIKYTRKRITLTFDPNGGEWDLTEGVHQIKGKFGERLPLIDITEIKKIDAKFTGWTEDLNAETVTTVRIPETYPAENHTYYSVWDEVNSNYIVKVYEENLDYPEDATQAQKYTLVAMNAAAGVPGQKSNYKALSRYGFDVEFFEQVTIKDIDEPSAVLEVFYNRRIFIYKFDLDAAYAKWKNVDGKDHNDYHSERYIYGKYESDFTEYSCIECCRDERNYINNNGEEVHGDIWNFEGWNEVGGKVDIKFTQDRQYIAIWDKGPPEYTIKHLFEQADETYAPDSRFPDEKYSAGSEILTKAKAYEGVPGYYALPFDQKKVNIDNSTVVEIKYNRATVTVTMNANGGFFNRGEQIVKISGKYLDPITVLPPSPLKEHHEFAKWQSVHGVLPADPTFPAKNIRYEAVYNRTGALYGVEYYLENLEDENYTMSRDDTDTKVGDYDAKTPVPVIFDIKEHKGFEFSKAYVGKIGISEEGLTVSGDKSTITISEIEPDDSTVVRVYLNRKKYDVTFDPNGLIWNTSGSWNGQDNGFYEDVRPRTLKKLKYGTQLTAVRTDFHSKDKREVFDYWDPDFTGVVTDEPVQKYIAVTKSMTVQYAVRYMFETLDCPRDNRVYETNPLFPDEIAQELPGFRTQVVVPASDFEKGSRFEGFRLNNTNSEHDIIVSEDVSKNIVEIKLDRREIELEFVANRDNAEDAEWPNGDGDEFDDKLDREVKGKFGAPVVLPSDLNEVMWISKNKLMKFVGWETKDGTTVDVASIGTFPSENMKYFAKWEEIDSSEATNNDGSSVIDSAEKDIELSFNKDSKNNYTVTVSLPFENTGAGLKKWKIYWKQAGETDFEEVTSSQEGFTLRQFTVDYFKNTIYVMAVYEGLAVPFSKEITLKVEK